MSVAAKYMKLAGFSERQVHRPATIKIVGSTGDPADKRAAIANQAAQALGFKTNFTHRRPVGHVRQVLRRAQGRRSMSARTSGGSVTGPIRRRCWTRRSPGTTSSRPTTPTGRRPAGRTDRAARIPERATTPLDKAMKAAEKTVGDHGPRDGVGERRQDARRQCRRRAVSTSQAAQHRVQECPRDQRPLERRFVGLRLDVAEVGS